ncbi:MAG: TonB-dependent receptor [Bacteroidales bacterium]|nr:TonB-dependent receptor [Bacteroidales bacterium]
MHLRKLTLIVISIFSFFTLNAQNGFIRGTVYDNSTGESLPGVTIFIEGTTTGTMSDFDGKFNLSVAPGKYNVRVSFISYETVNIRELEVKPGEVSLLDNLRLKEAKIELSEVTITAEVVRNSEIAMLTMKQKSTTLMDGISAVNFRRIGDSDAASSMKRVPGVSVEGGKYVYVRGLGDRYTKTTLNGVDIPGLDPDRNTVQMDLFPTNVIDNIIVHKSFSAHMPADFTGGVIDIETREFPEMKTGNISISMGYNPSMHFNHNYLTYEGGKTDFLGFDDGTRDIPAVTDIPQFSEVVGNPEGPKGIRYREILEGFNPVMATMKETSMMDYSAGISLGNQLVGKKVTWGYNVALSYKVNTEYYEDAEYGRNGILSTPGDFEMETRELQSGRYGVHSVLAGGLIGLALKTGKSKYRINVLHLQNGESKAGVFDYSKTNQGTVFHGIQHNLEYSQRSLTNFLVNGKYFIKKWEFEWKFSPTISKIEDPDIRFTRYEVRDGIYSISTESGFPERIWRDLDEKNYVSQLHFARDFKLRGEKARVMFGGSYIYKERSYSILNYAINIRNLSLTGDPNEIFSPENLWPSGGNAGKGTTYEAPFIPDNPNKFDANNRNTGIYASVEFSPINNLKAIVGIRSETFVQRYTGQDQLGTNVLDNGKVLDNSDLFPTVNLIYNLTGSQNLRASYAKTIARPSFRELSYAEISDPITGRTFIGGLFPDANTQAGITYWDGNLGSTDIQNFDLRWEMFGKNGQTISLGGFYKAFSNPIEIVQYATTSTNTFQPRNVGDGQVGGIEFEIRKDLEMISRALSSVTFTSNVTVTTSRIRLSETEYESRVENARSGEKIKEYRDMAGQSPYIINAGLAYNGGEKGFWSGFEAGVYYNVQGRTLEFVGINDRPDIYARPFHSLNLNTNKSFGKDKRIQAGIKIENLLNNSKESVFVSYKADDRYFTRLNQGMTFQMRISYKFF